MVTINGKILVLTIKVINNSDLQHEFLLDDLFSEQMKKLQCNNQKRIQIPALGTYVEAQSVNLGSISF